MDENKQQKVPSIETLIKTLTSSCDGAKKRDGVGFNKGDAFTGRRLTAMINSKIPFSFDDLKQSQELISRYSNQLKTIFGEDVEFKKSRTYRHVERDRKDFHYCRLTLDNSRIILTGPYNADLKKELSSLNNLFHGDRKCISFFDRKKNPKCWVFDYNGTIYNDLIKIIKKYNVAKDPNLVKPNFKLDELKKNLYCCYYDYRNETLNNKDIVRLYVVFDLGEYNEDIRLDFKNNSYIKYNHDSGQYESLLNFKSAKEIYDKIKKFNFIIDDSLKKMIEKNLKK